MAVLMLAMEGSDHLIHVGLRNIWRPRFVFGYAVAPWAVLAQMIACKGGGTGALEQMVVADFLKNNYEQHVDNLKVRLKAKSDALVEALEENFGTCRIRGAKWRDISLDQISAEVDTLKLADKALEAGIAYNPGPQWSVDGEAARNHLRICFANPNIEEIREGVAKLADVFHAETESGCAAPTCRDHRWFLCLICGTRLGTERRNEATIENLYPIRWAVMVVLCAVSVLPIVGVAPAEERQKSIFQPVLAKRHGFRARSGRNAHWCRGSSKGAMS